MLVLSILVAYLLGSISTSTLIARWLARIDIRQHGSGNAGATNTLRVLGLKWGVTVLVLDVLKGVVAVLIAQAWGHGNPWFLYLSGLAVIVGHNWPVFFGLRGGKGVATTIGVYLLLLPWPTVCAGIVALTLIVLTRFVSLGALTFVVLAPVFVVLIHPQIGVFLFTCAAAVLSIYRHRANIGRLWRREENQIFGRRG
ncbi:glycerol-3-phosphate 1-O-acyltransferase PlsY [Alicyclobacillus shizuokensis]|uniref:glycerol-3-phosphate 1-O-acyltransferase PlsY n=1 Tax=Alicyclobacillus shizuokensis TaxID=392014 RepID=UPI000837572E|nr:glycerol-3-phosphate 1-O-acyltransferase PlsY [Alicyclobacillus shizuokensis]